MTDDLTTLERDVIATILARERPVMRALRGQFERCHVVSRKATGVGFNTKPHGPSQIQPAPVAPGRMHLGDVTATIDGLAHGAGFVLCVQNGILDALEGFSFDEAWPDLSARHGASPGGVSPRPREPDRRRTGRRGLGPLWWHWHALTDRCGTSLWISASNGQ